MTSFFFCQILDVCEFEFVIVLSVEKNRLWTFSSRVYILVFHMCVMTKQNTFTKKIHALNLFALIIDKDNFFISFIRVFKCGRTSLLVRNTFLIPLQK